jgi:hypothetical protein
MSEQDETERHRHECEVRMLLREARKRGREWVRSYLDHKDVKGRREKLRADLNAQIKAGNTGKDGEWK